MIGIVTGLLAEARLARPLGLAVAGGGTAAGARRAAEQLAMQGVTTLISFGVAGGLDAALPPGALVIPATVLTPDGLFQADPALVAALQGPTTGRVFGASKVIAAAADKARLFAASGAAAVDLESGDLAAVAAERGLKFAVLRAVCDPADQDLPEAALVASDGLGAIGPGRILASLLRHPGQIPALLRLARHAGLARRTLAAHIGKIADIAADSRF